MTTIVSWVHANPDLFVVLWTALTAVLSLAARALSAFPRVHAALSLLSALGIDLPKILDAVKRLLTGEVPPAPPAEKKGPTAPTLPVLAIAGLLALGVIGCSADANRKVVNTTLETAQIICVLARAEFADEKAIMKACDISDDLQPYVHEILGQHRASVAAAAPRCTDGGR